MATDQDLLAPNEPKAFELVNPNGQGGLVLVCDHASNRVPARLHDLGLNEQELASHIGWDPGAARVARKLAARFNAPLLLSNYSRLVIDCNRWPADPESIPVTSGGIAIPGNVGLSEQETDCRRRLIFEPYQAAVATLLTRSAQQPRLLLSIHSFTPSMGGTYRPWSIGVCYRANAELAQRWVTAIIDGVKESMPYHFPERTGPVVGDNQPYQVEAGCDYTIPVQGESRGIPSIMLELRQDEIVDEKGVQVWSDIIAESWLAL
jgi:predicted N-formylglutamate amidohydrolase